MEVEEIIKDIKALGKRYDEMEDLAAKMLSAIITNFRQGNIKTPCVEGDAQLWKMIDGWREMYNRARPLKGSSVEASNDTKRLEWLAKNRSISVQRPTWPFVDPNQLRMSIDEEMSLEKELRKCEL